MQNIVFYSSKFSFNRTGQDRTGQYSTVQYSTGQGFWGYFQGLQNKDSVSVQYMCLMHVKHSTNLSSACLVLRDTYLEEEVLGRVFSSLECPFSEGFLNEASFFTKRVS